MATEVLDDVAAIEGDEKAAAGDDRTAKRVKMLIVDIAPITSLFACIFLNHDTWPFKIKLYRQSKGCTILSPSNASNGVADGEVSKISSRQRSLYVCT